MGDIYGLSGLRNHLLLKECLCNKFDVYLANCSKELIWQRIVYQSISKQTESSPSTLWPQNQQKLFALQVVSTSMYQICTCLLDRWLYMISKIKYRMMCLFDKNNSLIYWLDKSLQINVQSSFTFDLVGSKSIRS